MKHGLLLLISSCCLFSFVTPKHYDTELIHFNITNLRNTKGNLVLCFFRDKTSYNNGDECIRKEVKKNKIKNGSIQFSITMPFGTYGAVLLDDENLNDEMDYGMLMPKEGFGFSNFVPIISKPSFKDINFLVSNTTKKPINIKVIYL